MEQGVKRLNNLLRQGLMTPETYEEAFELIKLAYYASSTARFFIQIMLKLCSLLKNYATFFNFMLDKKWAKHFERWVLLTAYLISLLDEISSTVRAETKRYYSNPMNMR